MAPTRSHPNRTVLTLLAAAVLTLFGMLLAPAPSVSAAEYGPGINVGLGRLGAYLTPDGIQAYCLEIDKREPLDTTGGAVVGGWSDLSPDALAKLTWVLAHHGQSPDPVMTAAVNLYVWSVADAGTYSANGGDAHYLPRAGGNAGPVQTALEQLRAGAQAVTAPTGETGSATLTVELANAETGTITVAAQPSHATGVLELFGAVLAGGSAGIPVKHGDVIEFTTVVPSDSRELEVSASAAFTATTSPYPGAISIYGSGPGTQHLAAAAPLLDDSFEFSAQGTSDVFAIDFAPVATTSVAEAIVQPGGIPIDRLTAGVTPESPLGWRTGADGAPVPVIAEGTLYGPLTAAPAVTTEPPADAPIAWQENVTLTGAGEYSSSGAFAVQQPGFYTWVWRIDAATQSDTTAALLPEGYVWSDDFGLPDESFEVPVPPVAPAAEPSLPPTGLPVVGILGGAAALLAIGGAALGMRAIGLRRAFSPYAALGSSTI